MAVEWTDVTSYSRGGSREVRAWGARCGPIEVVVTRHIHYPPDVWIISMDLPGIGQQELESKDADAAKAEALELVREWCRSVLTEIGETT